MPISYGTRVCISGTQGSGLGLVCVCVCTHLHVCVCWGDQQEHRPGMTGYSGVFGPGVGQGGVALGGGELQAPSQPETGTVGQVGGKASC